MRLQKYGFYFIKPNKLTLIHYLVHINNTAQKYFHLKRSRPCYIELFTTAQSK